jgi:hypothetical protein
MSPMAETLLAIHARNPQFVADAEWYATARREARKRARAAGVTLNRYLAITAAMSPLQTWRTKNGIWPNFDRADEILRGERRGLPAAVRMADRIANGERADHVLGRKTLAFYRNLQSASSTAVTVDRWMMRAAGFEHIGPSRAQYATVSEAVREAAAAAGISPHAMQASVWSQVKRESEATS